MIRQTSTVLQLGSRLHKWVRLPIFQIEIDNDCSTLIQKLRYKSTKMVSFTIPVVNLGDGWSFIVVGNRGIEMQPRLLLISNKIEATLLGTHVTWSVTRVFQAMKTDGCEQQLLDTCCLRTLTALNSRPAAGTDKFQ
jgi:hypothetical protein